MDVKINLNKAIYVGVDTHTEEHTAVALNRFEEEKGKLQFENCVKDIGKFMNWLNNFKVKSNEIVVGLEGAGNAGQLLTSTLVQKYNQVYEINPLYTKQRREFGTNGRKSDIVDARLIAEVLIRKHKVLPKFTSRVLSPQALALNKLVWLWEDLSFQKARIKNHLHVLTRDWRLAQDEQTNTLEFLIQVKKKELKRISLTQNELKKKFLDLLPLEGQRVIALKGISTVLAAKLVVHTKGIERFRNINKFIQYAGIAPTEMSSGKSRSYRQNKKGNRALNSTLYLTTINQLRWNEKARVYYEKKIKEGKTKKHAIRCLMKRVACIVYGVMKHAQKGEKTNLKTPIAN